MSRIGAKLSSTAVSTCTASSATTSSETARCSDDEHEARRSLRRPALHLDDAEHDAGGEQDERDQRRSRESGTRARTVRPAAIMAPQPPPASRPSSRPRRSATRAAPGGRRRRSHGRAPRPSTIAAVLAMFASTQVAAATDTVRQCSAAGAPVRGSIDVMRVAAAAAPAADASVLDVASPPDAMRQRLSGLVGPGEMARRRRAPASRRRGGRPRRRCRRRG